MKNINKQKLTEGFTLIESLVAVSILMIAIASPMTLAQKGLATAILSKDEMTAGFLGQDAIEAVRNARDQIAVKGDITDDWLGSDHGLLENCICNPNAGEICDFDTPVSIDTQIKFCQIDSTAISWSTTINVGGFPTPKLKISYNVDTDGTKHFLKYDYNLLPSCTNFFGPGQCGVDSKFTRLINIIKDPTGTNPDEALINVRVSWDSPLGVQNIDIHDYIYNYSENL